MDKCCSEKGVLLGIIASLPAVKAECHVRTGENQLYSKCLAQTSMKPAGSGTMKTHSHTALEAGGDPWTSSFTLLLPSGFRSIHKHQETFVTLLTSGCLRIFCTRKARFLR